MGCLNLYLTGPVKKPDDVLAYLSDKTPWRPITAASSGLTEGSATLNALSAMRFAERASQEEYLKWVTEAMEQLKRGKDIFQIPSIGQRETYQPVYLAAVLLSH